MLLKGLYTTQVDRLPTEQYKRYMFSTFGISIEEDAKYGHYTGFIKRDPTYYIKVPILCDGKIQSFLDHYIRNYSATGIVDVKDKIKRFIKEDPERFKQLSAAMLEITKGGNL